MYTSVIVCVAQVVYREREGERVRVRETSMTVLLGTHRYCIEHGGRALLADDMGLGKTLQAICVACYYHQEWPLMVICPSSVKMAWAEVSMRYALSY